MMGRRETGGLFFWGAAHHQMPKVSPHRDFSDDAVGVISAALK